MKTTLTRELSECICMLAEMASSLKSILFSYEHSHTGKRCHDAAEANLVCTQLETFLTKVRESAEDAKPTNGASFLQRTVGLNQQMEAIAKTMDDDKTDCRICRALRFQAEGVRISMPALLRWSHGGTSGNADESLSIVLGKFQRCLAELRPVPLEAA